MKSIQMLAPGVSRRSPRAYFLLAAALVFAGSAAAQQSGSAAPDAPATAAAPAEVLTQFPDIDGVKVLRRAFGVMYDLESAKPRLETTRVIQRDGSWLGWVVVVDTDKPSLRWREEFVVPTPPPHWGMGASKADTRPPFVSADRLTGTTERRVPGGKGVTLSHTWALDMTDPPGPHTLRVYLEDVLVATFNFEVR